MKAEQIEKYLERPQEYEIYLEGVRRKARDWYSYYGRHPDLIDSRISQLEQEERVLQEILEGDIGNIHVRKETISTKLEVLLDLKKELWSAGENGHG